MQSFVAEFWMPALTQEILGAADLHMMAIFGALILLTKGSAIAPFNYTIF
jgi:Family of unknown function (DUF5989)